MIIDLKVSFLVKVKLRLKKKVNFIRLSNILLIKKLS